MKKKKQNIVTSLSEYIEFLNALPAKFSLCRGQWDATWPLLPKALRFDQSGKYMLYSPNEIDVFLQEFRNNAPMYMKHPEIFKDNIAYMALAQHYGLPTRLLDFTELPFIALLFAIEHGFDDNGKESENVDQKKMHVFGF